MAFAAVDTPALGGPHPERNPEAALTPVQGRVPWVGLAEWALSAGASLKLTVLSLLYSRSMLGRIQAQAFGFDQNFQAHRKDDFVMVSMVEEFVGPLLILNFYPAST